MSEVYRRGIESMLKVTERAFNKVSYCKSDSHMCSKSKIETDVVKQPFWDNKLLNSISRKICLIFSPDFHRSEFVSYHLSACQTDMLRSTACSAHANSGVLFLELAGPQRSWSRCLHVMLCMHRAMHACSLGYSYAWSPTQRCHGILYWIPTLCICDEISSMNLSLSCYVTLHYGGVKLGDSYSTGLLSWFIFHKSRRYQ